MIKDLFNISKYIRYVAVYKDGELTSEQRDSISNSSDSESDKYEELLVNPTLLKLATQRGNIDCGGLDYLLVRYGNFFQLVVPVSRGHISICIEPKDDVISIVDKLREVIFSTEKRI